MRPVPGEQDPLLRSSPLSANLSSFNLEDDTEVMHSATTSQRAFGHKDSNDGSFGELSSGGHASKLRVGLDSHFWPLGTSRKFRIKLFLSTCYLAALAWTLMVMVGPLVLHFVDKDKWCNQEDTAERYLKRSGDGDGSRFINDDMSIDEKRYDNPDYNTDPCRYARLPYLAGLTLEECDYCRRMLTSVLLGGAIGYERRSSDRSAGIRTMGLVSLGACFFTISSLSAFKSSTMGWDSSRVTAALPSGVGFLGAALVWKGSVNVDSQEMHQVHGLTTAASVWLSAAIGVGAGGALYFVSVYSTVLILLVLRFGPRLYLHDDFEDEDDLGDRQDSVTKEPEDASPSDSIAEETEQPVKFENNQQGSRRLAKSKRPVSVPTFHG